MSPYGQEVFLHQLLGKALAAKASDVHLKVGQPPGARVLGEMVYFRVDKIRAEDTEAVARVLLARHPAREQLDGLQELDTSYDVATMGRFRVNIYRQRGSLAVVMRYIPATIPTIDSLSLPSPVRHLAERERGLVLVVGATGSGKSTTLAAMIGHINKHSAKHIVTIEDPIEFVHADEKSSISQREIGSDTGTFASALRAAMRQDPDVILVGEIRDAETMEVALQAAETGHLVLSTVHTPDATRTVYRMLSLSKGIADVRERIADTLQGILAQRLLPKRDGSGRILALEVLIGSGTVRESIKRPENNPSLRELMEKGVTPYGMQTFDMHVRQLAAAGVIDKEQARAAGGF